MADTPTRESQPLWDQLGLSKEDFDRLPPSERITLQRTHQPQPPVVRRPVQGYQPTAKQQCELDAISQSHDRTARYRAMALEAAQPQ